MRSSHLTPRVLGDEVRADQRLLDRLDNWLINNSAVSDAATAVLRGPWEHLAHTASGSDAVRKTELQRIQNAGRAEDRVRSDYRGRYAIELLQNAHDACADARKVGEAWLRLTPSALLIANQGVPFTAERIDSLLQLGDSTKSANRARHHTIGYKGIGFSAVLEITDRPQIISRGVSFCFDRGAAQARVRQLLGEDPAAVPMRYFPFPLQGLDLGDDANLVDELLGQGAVTVIRLPLTDGRKAQEVAEELRTGLRPETLLFMRHLNRVTIGTPDGASTWTRRAGEYVGHGRVQHLRQGGQRQSWLVAQKTIELPEDEVVALEDPLWATVRDANVAVAVPWRNGKPDPDRGSQPLHVYFPTDDHLGRALLVHGDFYVQSNRRRITAVGTGADISLRIADAAAELTAELAVSLAGHGNALLRTLAPQSEPDGFGARLAELLDARLSECPMLHPADGSALAPATALGRLASPLDRRRLAALVQLLSSSNDVLRPGDDLGCGEWLERLGMRRLPAVEVAGRLTPPLGVAYDAALGTVALWFEALTRGDGGLVWPTLQRRPLLLDTDGAWRPASALVQLDPRTPAMPAPLRRATYQPPHSRVARTFVDEVLQVEVLTPERALRTVVDYLSMEIREEDGPEILRFLQDLWRSARTAYGDINAEHLGRVLVPARVLGDRKGSTGWAPSRAVYFDKRWTGNDLLERLYGGFRQPEFLAVDPPTDRAGRTSDKQFWATLGVADAPRMRLVPAARSELAKTWRALAEVQAVARCPDGHTGSGRRERGVYLDRLDEILARADERSLRALARHLTATKKPFGDPVVVACSHSAHARATGRPALGFQRWLLTTRPWLPTYGGPSGARLRIPHEAWLDVPKGSARAVLATPSLRLTDPAALEIPSVHRAKFARLEAALWAVQAAYPQLAEAPREVQDGVDWLLRKLDASASRGPGAEGLQNERPRLPALSSGVRVWADSPVIADTPGADQVPDVAWLPNAPWSGLQRRYRLERASTVVSTDVTGRPAPHESRPLLSRSDRIHLLALLLDRGGEASSLAYRLGHLADQRMTSLQVDYEIHGRRWSDEPVFHLRPQRDRRGRVRSAELLSLIELGRSDLVRLGHTLAQYLGAPERGDLVGSFLLLRDDLVAASGILASQIAEAEDALRRFRGGEDVTSADADEDPPQSTDPEPATEAPVEQPTTGTASGPPVSPATARVTPRSWQASGNEGPSVGAGPGSSRPARPEPPGPAPRATVVFGKGERRAVTPRPVGIPRPGGTRPVTGDRPGAGTVGQLVSAEGIDRRVTEKDAEDVASDFLERRFGARVERVGSQNLGWDLTATLPDGNQLLVEVKGFAGTSDAFVLTRGERRAARRRAEYRVCVVNRASGSSGELAWFEKVDELFAEDRLEPYQWVVLDWPSADPEFVPWSRE